MSASDPIVDFNLDSPFSVNEIKEALQVLAQLPDAEALVKAGEKLEAQTQYMEVSPEASVSLHISMPQDDASQARRMAALYTALVTGLVEADKWRAEVNVTGDVESRFAPPHTLSIEVSSFDHRSNHAQLQAEIAALLQEAQEKPMQFILKQQHINNTIYQNWREMPDSGDGMRDYGQYTEARPENTGVSFDIIGYGREVVPLQSLSARS